MTWDNREQYPCPDREHRYPPWVLESPAGSVSDADTICTVCGWSREDSREAEPAPDWAEGLVQTSAWMHIAFSPDCTGWTMASSGRATCGSCGWQLSARMTDAGEVRSGRFACFALGAIGAVFVYVNEVKRKAAEVGLRMAELGHKARVEIDETGTIVVTDLSALDQVAITHTVKV